MNKLFDLPVQALLALTTFAGLSAGCVDIAGGSVEAKWELQYGGPDCAPPGQSEPACRLGTRISCEQGRVAQVQFVLEPVGGGEDPCASEDRCRFPCSRKVGTTPFILPAGEYAISLSPLGADGAALPDATTPSPVVRTVRTAELTNLNVNLIIVDSCADCLQ